MKTVFSLALLLTSASSAAPTNVVFCIADDASPHFGVYGHSWVKTPQIDALGKAGLVFENAYTPTAKCAPSRACILTGRNPWLLEEAGNHQAFFPSKFKTFSEALHGAGIHVGAYGKVWGPGQAKHADGTNRDFHLAPELAANPGEAFQTFLERRKPQQPFFFWFGSKNPHRPYKPDAGLEVGKKQTDIPKVPAFWPDNDIVRRDMLDYATEIEAYDSEVAQVVAVLKKTGEIDNTMLIVTSDHGMPFPRVKGHNYHMANHVPFIVHWPQQVAKPGTRVQDFITFSDLAPTFFEVLGLKLEQAGLAEMTGKSLLDLVRGTPQHERTWALLGRERTDVYARAGSPTGLGYPIRGIREGNFYYLHNFKPERWPCGDPELGLKDTDDSPTKRFAIESGQASEWWQFSFGKRPQEELFDLSKDPDCVANLASHTENAATVTRLREKLFSLLKAQNDPRLNGGGDAFDHYPTTKATGERVRKAKGKE